MSGPKPELPQPPWYVLAAWWVWAELHWPAEVRRLKREGWRHTGFRRWESP